MPPGSAKILGSEALRSGNLCLGSAAAGAAPARPRGRHRRRAELVCVVPAGEFAVTAKLDANFDVVIIGTGPGGEGAAMHLAKNHKQVAIVERFRQIGGGCTHWGTIPSKSLRHAIFQIAEANKNPMLRSAGISLALPFAQMRKAANSVVDRQVEMRHTYYERNGVTVVSGHARFLDPFTIEAE